jgi:hypothetical protein
MTTPSQGGRFGLMSVRSEPHAAATLDAAEYARAVGNRVTELVEQALEDAPDAVRTDPNSMAEVIADLVVDRVADPDRSELADMVAPLWTAEHTRRVLKLSRPTMLDRRKAGSLLALKTTDGDFFYPVSQFERRDGKVQVKPALRKFMMVLRDRDPWTVAILIHTPAPELGDLTPLDWVRQGRDSKPLLDYAHVVNTEYAR